MAIWYVSNSAVNGYVSGSDANAGTSPSTALLTVNQANALASANDSVYINPTGINYSENSGSNFLAITKALTIQTDPAYYQSVGLATLTSPTAGSQLMQIFPGTTLLNIALDNQSVTRANGMVRVNNTSSTAVNLTNVVPKNIVGTNYVFLGPSSSATNIVFTKCVLSSANGNSSTAYFLNLPTNSTSGNTFQFLGVTASGVGGLIVDQCVSSHSVTVGAAGDGTRSSVVSCTGSVMSILSGSAASNLTYTVIGTDVSWTNNSTAINFLTDISSTYRGSSYALSLTGCTFAVNNYTGSGLYITRICNTTTNFTVSNNTLTGTSSGIVTFCYNQCVGINNFTFTNNTVNATGVSATSVVTSVSAGTGLQIKNNTINWDGNFHIFQVGNDTPFGVLINQGGTKSDQNLGDTSGNAYIAQPYTYPTAANSYGGENMFFCAELLMKKVGSPTGTITVSIYTDNAGAPNTSQTVSNYTLSTSLLTTGYLQTTFWSDARWRHTNGTNYWIVIHYTGTNDGTNYVQIQKNTAAGTLNTSSNGTAWSAGSGSLIFAMCTHNIECVTPVIQNNLINMTASATQTTHCTIIAGTDGGTISNNYMTGGAIGALLKDVDGSVNAAVAYSNLYYFTNPGVMSPIFDKGSKQAYHYNNTCILSSTSGDYGIQVISDPATTIITSAVAFNGVPSRNCTIVNNIIYTLSTTAAISIGSASINDTNVTGLVMNNNIYYAPNATNFAQVNLGTAGAYTNYASFAAYQSGTSLDSNSTYQDPLLSGEAAPTGPSSFIPSLSSPAHGGGVNTNGLAPVDYAGISFPLTPDIGAYSIAATLLAEQASKISFNPFTNNFDYQGLTKSISDQLYQALTSVAVVSSSIGIPPSKGKTVVFANANAGAITLTLPTAVGYLGTIVVVKTDTSTNGTVLQPLNSQTINGSSSVTITTPNLSYELASNGSNWQIV